MRIRSLATAMALALLAAPALATTSITPKAQGSTGWSMDFGLDSVTGNIRSMSFLIDPATGLLISPLAAGGTVVIGGTLPAFASTPSFTIAGSLPAFASTPTVNLGTIAGVATAANQTGGTQKTQIVDASGNVVAETSNNLNVQCANCSGSGVSTADEASFTAATSLFAGSGGFFQTTPTTNPLTTGQQGMAQMTANRALFMNPRNAAGAEIATAGAPFRIDPTGTTTQPVSGTVTSNAGTNLNTSALALESGGNLQTLAGSITASVQQSNEKQINGVPPLMGNGVTGTGSQRVTVASDNTAFSVNDQGAVTTGAPTYVTGTNAPLSLTTSGALRTDSTSGTQPVSGTVTANAGTNLNTSLLALETGGNLQTLAGAVSGAVEQANTAKINNVTPLMGNGVTGTGSQRVTIASDNTAFSVNAVQSGTWNIGTITTLPALVTSAATIGKVDLLGNAGGIMDAAGQNAASPASELLIAGQFNTSPTTITSGNVSPFQLDSSGNLNVNVKAGGGAGGTSSSFAAAFPSAGTAIGAKSGANMVNLVADGSNNLDVNCVVGCAGGTTSNASSAVATGSTNGQTVAWLYLFNGTTWDQAQADGSKNLKVNVAAGAVTANAGTNLNTSALALETGGNLATLAGAITSSVEQANTKQINGVTPLMGNGVSGTGSQRVNIASDNTPFAVTANAGTNLNTSALALDTSVNGIINSQASATSGQKGTLSLGAVTTSAPATYVTGQTNPLSLTTAGALRTDASTVNGIAPLTGNGVTGTGSQRVTIASDNTAFSVNANAGTNLNTSTLAVESGGNLATLAGAITSSVEQANTKQINGVTPLMGNGVSGTGSQRVNIASDNTPFAVTANAGTNLNTSALALDTSVNGILVAQGSTTATGPQKGPLVQAAVTTGVPTYITGNTSPLSLTTSGALRTDSTSGTQPISAASLPLMAGAATSANQPTAASITTPATTAGTGTVMMGAATTGAPTDTTGNAYPLSLDTAGNLRVNIMTGATTGNVAQSSTTASNSGPMVQGSVLAAAPTYITGNTNPLSLTTSGALRVDASATAIAGGTVGSAPPSGGNNVMVGAKDSSGNVGNLTLDGAQGTGVKTAGSVNVTATNCSGTITTGATAQNAFTAQAGLHGFTISNIDTAEVLWINFTGTAAANGSGSFPLGPATPTTFAAVSSFTSPPGFGLNSALSIVAATTAHKFSCTRW